MKKTTFPVKLFVGFAIVACMATASCNNHDTTTLTSNVDSAATMNADTSNMEKIPPNPADTMNAGGASMNNGTGQKTEVGTSGTTGNSAGSETMTHVNTNTPPKH